MKPATEPTHETHLKERRPDRYHVIVRLTEHTLKLWREPFPEFGLVIHSPVFGPYYEISTIRIAVPMHITHTTDDASQELCGTALLVLVFVCQKSLQCWSERLERFSLQDLDCNRNK